MTAPFAHTPGDSANNPSSDTGSACAGGVAIIETPTAAAAAASRYPVRPMRSSFDRCS
ncbi:hypothetical protein [Nocardia wallacei]|uniref:hypothetical protein n=1 Tax=Nocardia wallacei TaxID=480035 RepID=UPI002454900C|nr:hypothetical protein [Nocardia wallacei]